VNEDLHPLSLAWTSTLCPEHALQNPVHQPHELGRQPCNCIVASPSWTHASPGPGRVRLRDPSSSISLSRTSRKTSAAMSMSASWRCCPPPWLGASATSRPGTGRQSPSRLLIGATREDVHGITGSARLIICVVERDGEGSSRTTVGILSASLLALLVAEP
jgi:hypothetical protein